ncbi:hypothetical protein Vadar_029309 [Vaccinium darrowii]|uniref:Uncharacterized protein n=1 Tax=Vaccinium darrowii TaxID=229202 RepID=A0ACB7YQQ0_9ERIC|nr:hypothetical protein Vadar_029309 [Vaccinium darrowii]
MANSEIIEEITASSDSIEEIIEEITASSDSIEEVRASSDSTKALRSSPSANHHQNAASSSATDNENDQHVEAPPPSFETICNDLRLAWKKYTAHMNAKIYVAGKEFKRLRNLGSTEKDFDELRKAIANLQIPRIPSQVNIVSPTKTKDKSSKPSLAANYMAKYFSSKPKQLENNHQNAASSSATTKKNPHGEALPPSSEMIPNDFRLMNSAWKKYMDQMNAKFSVASKEFKRLRRKYPDHMNAQINMPSEEFKKTDFDKLQKAIKKLKSHVKEWQIPLTSNEDDHDGEDLSQTIGSELNLLVSAFEEAQKFMESTEGEINQARAKSNELQKAYSEKQQKGESSKLRKDIGKLRVLIRPYGEIRSTDSNRHPYEWPDINGVGEGRMDFFFQEPNEPNTDGVDGDKMTDKFNGLTEPVRYCLLCFFKFPPKEFIRRTTMIYLWIGQRYILQHLQQKYPSRKEEELLSLEEDVGKKIFDELITNGFIVRCSLEPNSCRMSPSARSSLYKEAEDKGFTSNGTRDLDAESVRGKPIGHSCLINVGEAVIDRKPEIFENMEHIQSLYLGRWQSLATHHIELADTKILHGMSKLKNLTFLSLRGISLITDLPNFISELNDLKILDLRACHNLEGIPDEISSLKKLTHLDMSECYFLEHMPKSLAQLSKLEVLKGFFIGDSKNNKQSCTLSNLSRLSEFRKLNIYTSAEKFPTRSDLNALTEFEGLLKLTISWGGCSSTRKSGDTAASASQEEGEETLHLGLQKLDLQGFPMRSLPCWLCPPNLKQLRKLYIRGGNLRDLGQLRKTKGSTGMLRYCV